MKAPSRHPILGVPTESNQSCEHTIGVLYANEDCWLDVASPDSEGYELIFVSLNQFPLALDDSRGQGNELPNLNGMFVIGIGT